MRAPLATTWTLLLLVGCASSPSPSERGGQTAPEAAPPVPVFEPDTPPVTPGCIVRPRLRDAAAARHVLTEAYPDELRDRQIGGTAEVWMLIDGEGSVAKASLAQSSGNATIDEAAVGAATALEFRAESVVSCSAPAWVVVPITFSPAGHTSQVSNPRDPA